MNPIGFRCPAASNRLKGTRLRLTALDSQNRVTFVALGLNTGSIYLYELAFAECAFDPPAAGGGPPIPSSPEAAAPATALAASASPAVELRFISIVSLSELREPIHLLATAPRQLYSAANAPISTSTSTGGATGGATAGSPGGGLNESLGPLSAPSSTSSPSPSFSSSAGSLRSFISAVVTSPQNRIYFIELGLQGQNVHDGNALRYHCVRGSNQVALRPAPGANANRVLARLQHDCQVTAVHWLEAVNPSSGSIDPDCALTLFFGDEKGRVFVVEDVQRFHSGTKAQAARLAASALLMTQTIASADAAFVCATEAVLEGPATPVVQFSQLGRHLSVSTHTGVVVVDLAAWDRSRRESFTSATASLSASGSDGKASNGTLSNYSSFTRKIGSKERDTPAGACFAPGTSSLLSARPAKRVWVANPEDGAVTQTLNFSNLTKIAPTAWGEEKVDDKASSKIARKVVFTLVVPLSASLVAGVTSARHFPGLAEDTFKENALGSVTFLDVNVDAPKIVSWSLDHVGATDLRTFFPASVNPSAPIGYVAISPMDNNEVWCVLVRKGRRSAPEPALAAVSVAVATSTPEVTSSVPASGHTSVEVTSVEKIEVSLKPVTRELLSPSITESPREVRSSPETQVDQSALDSAVVTSTSPISEVAEKLGTEPTPLKPKPTDASLDTLSTEESSSVVLEAANFTPEDTPSPLAGVETAATSELSPRPASPTPTRNTTQTDAIVVESTPQVTLAASVAVSPLLGSLASPRKVTRRKKGSQNVVDILSPSDRPILTQKQQAAAAAAKASANKESVGNSKAGASVSSADFLQRAGLSVSVRKVDANPVTEVTETSSTSATLPERNAQQVEVVTVVQATTPVSSESVEDERKKGIYRLLMEKQALEREEAKRREEEERRIAQEQTLEHKVGKSMEIMQNLSKTALQRTESVAQSQFRALAQKSKVALTTMVSDIAAELAEDYNHTSADFDMSGVGGVLVPKLAPVESPPSPPLSTEPALVFADQPKLSKDAAVRLLVKRTKWIHECCLCYEQQQSTPESVVDAVVLSSVAGDAEDLSNWLHLLVYTLESLGVKCSDATDPEFSVGLSAVETAFSEHAAAAGLSSLVCSCLSAVAECATVLCIRSANSSEKTKCWFDASAAAGLFTRWSRLIQSERALKRILQSSFPISLVADHIYALPNSAQDSAADSISSLICQILQPLVRASVRSAMSRDSAIVSKLEDGGKVDDARTDSMISVLKGAHNLALAVFFTTEILAKNPAARDRICQYITQEWRAAGNSDIPAGFVLLLLRGSLRFSETVSENPQSRRIYLQCFAKNYLESALQRQQSTLSPFAKVCGKSLAAISDELGITTVSPALIQVALTWDKVGLSRTMALKVATAIFDADPASRDQIRRLCSDLSRTLAVESGDFEVLCSMTRFAVWLDQTTVESSCSCTLDQEAILQGSRAATSFARSSGCPSYGFWSAVCGRVSVIHKDCSAPFTLPETLRGDFLSVLSATETMALSAAFPTVLLTSMEADSRWLLQGVLQSVQARELQCEARAELLESIDSYLWRDKATVAPPALVSAMKSELRESAVSSVRRAVLRQSLERDARSKRGYGATVTVSELMQFALDRPVASKGVSFPADLAGPVRQFSDKQLHWGTTAVLLSADSHGGDCKLCTLPLHENVGNVSAVFVYPCGHAFHQHCVSNTISTLTVPALPSLPGLAKPSVLAPPSTEPATCVACHAVPQEKASRSSVSSLLSTPRR